MSPDFSFNILKIFQTAFKKISRKYASFPRYRSASFCGLAQGSTCRLSPASLIEMVTVPVDRDMVVPVSIFEQYVKGALRFPNFFDNPIEGVGFRALIQGSSSMFPSLDLRCTRVGPRCCRSAPFACAPQLW